MVDYYCVILSFIENCSIRNN